MAKRLVVQTKKSRAELVRLKKQALNNEADNNDNEADNNDHNEYWGDRNAPIRDAYLQEKPFYEVENNDDDEEDFYTDYDTDEETGFVT